MTLGADASTRAGRAEFLGIWRMLSDIGASGGPVLLSAVAAAASLAIGMTMVGAFGHRGCVLAVGTTACRTQMTSYRPDARLG